MLLQIVPAAISLLAAGFCFKWQRDAKTSLELAQKNSSSAQQSANLSVTQAQTASKDRAASEQLLIKSYEVLEQTKQVRENSNTLSQYALKSCKDCVLEAAEHSSDAKGYAFTSEGHSLVSQKHAEVASTHVDKAAEHVSTAGTLAVAVTKAAQAAAEKSQKQAECTFCKRAVNKYKLRENGNIVCKHCEDRRK